MAQQQWQERRARHKPDLDAMEALPLPGDDDPTDERYARIDTCPPAERDLQAPLESYFEDMRVA